MAHLEGRQLLKGTYGKVNLPKSPCLEAASDIISEYLATGAIGAVDELLEMRQKCIAYHFGVGGPGGRNRTDGTPYLWNRKEMERIETNEMQEMIEDLRQRGVVVDELDTRVPTQKD
jgi:hypothetical protein